MINAEKYRDEILAVTNKHEYFAIKADNPTVIIRCNDLEQCRGCLFDNNGTCSSNKMKWLLSEYKEPVKLTRFERDILEYALKNTDYRFITRDDEDKLYFYSTKPRKYNRYWQYLAQNQRRLLSDDLFRFVQWADSKPTSIQEVLQNCEVVDNG